MPVKPTPSKSSAVKYYKNSTMTSLADGCSVSTQLASTSLRKQPLASCLYLWRRSSPRKITRKRLQIVNQVCATRWRGQVVTFAYLISCWVSCYTNLTAKCSEWLQTICSQSSQSTLSSYYRMRMRIGKRTQPVEWYHFQWPWVISNPDFKVTIYSTSINSTSVQCTRFTFGTLIDISKY